MDTMDRSEIRRKIQHLKKKLRRTRTISSSDSSSIHESPPPKRRRRIISSGSAESEPVNENNEVATVGSVTEAENNLLTLPSETNPVSDEVISLLGEDPTLNTEYGEDIHPHVAVRWNHILQNGVKKERRTELLNKYLPPANCTFLEAPKLNEEIKAAVPESALKRDEKLEIKQAQLGSGVTCVGKALEIALKIPEKEVRDQIVKYLGDGGQILCDLHNLESMTRRSLLSQSLNKNTKDAVKNLTRDNLLFGGTLPDKLKAVKACSKSAIDLKITNKPTTRRNTYDSVAGPRGQQRFTPNTLNWRGPSRRTTYSAMTAGGYRERRQPQAPAPRRPPPNRSQRAPPPPTKRY